LKAVNFEAVANWPGCYFHRRLSGFLVVYVDDFKLVAPRKNLQALWKLIGQKLNLEPPTPFGRFLGCETRSYPVILNPSQISGFHKLGAVRGPKCGEQPSAPRTATVMEYDMTSFMMSCVALYEELTGRPIPQREVHTPFVDDETNWVESGERGELTEIALKVLMKVLYGARMCKYDILRATCMLARRVSKWDKECDRRLLRLMMYIRTTAEYHTYAYAGDAPQNCAIGLFADADFAGCKSTAKSTSGVVVAVVGASTFFLLRLCRRNKIAFRLVQQNPRL
jgi:hypothetical protein